MLLTKTVSSIEQKMESESGEKEIKLLLGKIQSIRQYFNILQNDPEEAKHLENQWEKSFYKNELKAALSLNHCLVKLVGEKEQEMEAIFLELGQLQKKIHRLTEEKQMIYSLKKIPDENNQLESNKCVTPEKKIKKAFEAERKILGAKYSQEKSEFQKMMEHRQQLLKSNKEQNSYLRDKLITLGQKLSMFEEDIHHYQKQNAKLKKQLKKMDRKTEQNNEDEGQVLNMSPIALIYGDNQEQLELFSFKDDTPSQKSDNCEELKKEIQQLKVLLKQKEEECVKLQMKTMTNTKNQYYDELENDCLYFKKVICEKQEEISEYKAIFMRFNENEKNCQQLKEKNHILEKEIKILQETVKFEQKLQDNQNIRSRQAEKCEQCLNLHILNGNLYQQLEQVRSEMAQKKVEMEKFINVALFQEREWQKIFNNMGINVKE